MMEKMKIQGRYAMVSGELWMGSSLCEAGFRVKGATRVRMSLKADDSVTDPARMHLRPRYAVRIDGKLAMDAQMSEPEETITVMESDTPVEAEIRLIKLSECSQSLMALTGVETDGEISPLPTRDRRISFIGDSITAGYGVDAGSGEEHFTTATENAEESYAGLVAEDLGMDRELFCISGAGIVSGYTGDPAERNILNLLPPWYEKVGRSEGTFRLPDGRRIQEIAWDFSRFQPEWVVVHLGTNDLSWCQQDPERKAFFRREYAAFLEMVRQRNPDARLLCVLGLLGSGLNEMVQRAVADYQERTGDHRISVLLVEEQNGERDGLGADSHPSKITQRRLADFVIQKIQTIEAKVNK